MANKFMAIMLSDMNRQHYLMKTNTETCINEFTSKYRLIIT